jgi:hypothetical protein
MQETPKPKRKKKEQTVRWILPKGHWKKNKLQEPLILLIWYWTALEGSMRCILCQHDESKRACNLP